MIDPERADTCHDRLRYDVRRIKGSTDSYLEDRRVNLEKAEEKGQLSNQISLNCRIHLFLQEDVEGHDSEIPEVGWLLRCTRVRSLAAAKKQSASRKRSKAKKQLTFGSASSLSQTSQKYFAKRSSSIGFPLIRIRSLTATM